MIAVKSKPVRRRQSKRKKQGWATAPHLEKTIAAPQPRASRTVPPKPPLDCSWLDLNGRTGLRPPTWCWQRTVMLLDRGAAPQPRWDEPVIYKCLAFAKLVLAAKTIDARAEVAKREPALWEAYKIFTADEGNLKAVFEAWVLTGLPQEEISQRTGVPIAVVQSYEQFFFDVRDRLRARAFIFCDVIPCLPEPRATIADVLKRYAYVGGPFVLAAIIEVLVGAHANPAPGATLEPSANADHLHCRAAIAMWVWPLNEKTIRRWLRFSKLVYGFLTANDDLAKARKSLRKALGLLESVLRLGNKGTKELIEALKAGV